MGTLLNDIRYAFRMLRNAPGFAANGYIHRRGDVFHPLSGALVEHHAVTPDYFRAMGIPLHQGRIFTAADLNEELARDARVRELRKQYPDKPPAAETNAIVFPTVVNRVMVRTFWPGQDPLGQVFSFGAKDGPWYQVIGVVGDVKEWGLTHAPVPEAYTALDGDSRMFVVVHTTLPPDSVVPQIRQAVAQLDAGLPLFNVRTMGQVIADQAVGQQFVAALVGMFSSLALLLAAVGIYGVLSYLVTQRTREIGIRMSLGATRGRVLGLVLSQGLKLAAMGLAIGLLAAPIVSRWLAGTLHEVKWHDPMILVATPFCLALVTYLACYLPARRATKVDPVVALRYE